MQKETWLFCIGNFKIEWFHNSFFSNFESRRLYPKYTALYFVLGLLHFPVGSEVLKSFWGTEGHLGPERCSFKSSNVTIKQLSRIEKIVYWQSITLLYEERKVPVLLLYCCIIKCVHTQKHDTKYSSWNFYEICFNCMNLVEVLLNIHQCCS